MIYRTRTIQPTGNLFPFLVHFASEHQARLVVRRRLEAQDLDECRRYVAESGIAQTGIQCIVLPREVIYDEGHRIERVGCPPQRRTILAEFRLARLFPFHHVVRVAVVCRNHQAALHFAQRLDDSPHREVDGLEGDDRGIQVAGVPHHVAAGEIAPDELVPRVPDGVDENIGGFG